MPAGLRCGACSIGSRIGGGVGTGCGKCGRKPAAAKQARRHRAHAPVVAARPPPKPANMTEHSGDTSMFGIFILTIATLVLIPYTLYHFCSADNQGDNAAWAEKVGIDCSGFESHLGLKRARGPFLTVMGRRCGTISAKFGSHAPHLLACRARRRKMRALATT
eukprot:353267-Chlamydomonas_euryale.AAC.2